MIWTQELIQQLRELRSVGHTVPEIAEKLGFTQHATRHKVKRLKLPNRHPKVPFTEADRISVVAMLHDGKPVKYVARTTGFGIKRIREIREQEGFVPIPSGQRQHITFAVKAGKRLKSRERSHAWPMEVEYKLRDMWEAGYTASDIGNALGYTKGAVAGKRRRLKLKPRPSCVQLTLPRRKNEETKRAQVVDLLNSGSSIQAIRDGLHLDQEWITKIRDEEGIAPLRQSRAWIREYKTTLPPLSHEVEMPFHVPDQLSLVFERIVLPFTGPTQRRCQMPLWADGERTRFVNGEPDFCGQSVSRGPYCAQCAGRAYERRLVAEAVA